MRIPTPDEVRLPARSDGSRPVRWDVVDPVLRALRFGAPGSLTAVAKATGISRTALTWRRRRLGMARLSAGRGRASLPTATEARVVRLIARSGLAKAARELDISKGAAAAMRSRAEAKADFYATLCEGCRGCGVRDCPDAERPPGSSRRACGMSPGATKTRPHMHVCEDCGGTGRRKEESP